MKDRLQIAIQENISEYLAPYIPFPENPTISVIDNTEVYDYLSEEQVSAAIDLISSQISFSGFDAVLVNMEGATYLFNRLAEKFGNKKKPIEIEYHGHNGKLEVNKPVPENLKKMRCLIIDDVYDSGHTLNAIRNEGISPDSVCVALVSKLMADKEYVPNIIYGAKVDNKWLAGSGMDLKDEHAGPFRILPRIVVMKSD